MRILPLKKHNPRARRLLPLVRSDDLGIEAGEVLVDLVLAVVFGFLLYEAGRVSKSDSFPAFFDCRVADLSLTLLSMHARRAFSSVAHPAAAWPEDAQQPLAECQRVVPGEVFWWRWNADRGDLFTYPTQSSSLPDKGLRSSDRASVRAAWGEEGVWAPRRL